MGLGLRLGLRVAQLLEVRPWEGRRPVEGEKDLKALLEAALQRHEVGRPIVEQALLAERGDQQGEGTAQVAPHLVRGSGD